MNAKVEQKWGFGMAPIKIDVQQKRKKCVTILMDALKNETSSEQILDIIIQGKDALSEIKGLFNRIQRQDQWDWFTVFEQFGCPGRIKSKNIAYNISELRKVLMKKSDKNVFEIYSNLIELNLEKHLDKFLNPKTSFKEPQKIYVLSTREQKDLLKIGFTTRSVRERVNEINSATGVVIPYGVRAVWCVKNAQFIEKKIHEKLSKYRVRNDREFFSMNYFDAFKSIMKIIKDESLIEL